MITYLEYNELVKKYNESQDTIYLLETKLYILETSSPEAIIPSSEIIPVLPIQQNKNLIFAYNKYNNKHKSKFLM
jgi:hypothetical protein